MNPVRSAALAMLVLFNVNLAAQSAIEVTSETDKTKANLGDVIRYTLTVKRQGDMSQAPTVVLPSFEGFRVGGSYSNSMMNFINGAASATNQQIVDLIAVKSGEVVIEPAKIRFMNAETKQYENIETKPVTVIIGQGKRKSAAAATPPAAVAPTAEPDIRSIKYSYHFDFKGLLPYILLSILFITAVYFAWKKIFARKQIQPAPPAPEDHRKTALRRIKKAAEIMKTGDVKSYCTQLYEIIRDFLNSHFGSSFSELTTQEIIKKLEELKARGADTERILDFMKECDLVKFADYKPADREIEAMETKAEDIVNNIK